MNDNINKSGQLVHEMYWKVQDSYTVKDFIKRCNFKYVKNIHALKSKWNEHQNRSRKL